jgi:hypothetical protein
VRRKAKIKAYPLRCAIDAMHSFALAAPEQSKGFLLCIGVQSRPKASALRGVVLPTDADQSDDSFFNLPEAKRGHRLACQGLAMRSTPKTCLI